MIDLTKKSVIFCPVENCKKELVPMDEKHYESLEEHVFDPNGTPSLKTGYGCPAVECDANKLGIRWTDDGSLYIGPLFRKLREVKFVDDNDAPFGTFDRRQKVEIYKTDENYNIIKTPWFYVKRKFCYKADEDGNILKKWSKLETWIINNNGTATFYNSGLHMLIYCFKEFYRYKKEYRKQEISKWGTSQFLNCFKLQEWDKRWWKVSFNWWINFWYKGLKVKLETTR